MADACYNELQQRTHNELWASRLERRTAGHIYVEQEIETVDGPIHRLLLVDGHEPSPAERKQDDDRLRKLIQDPKALKKEREADEKRFGELLRVIPDAFLFEDQGKQGNLERVAFHPNPAYKPTTYEETVLHALSGTILVDLQEKRLVQISGTLMQQVDFGHGVIGQVKKGGTIEVSRIRLSPGIWKTNSSKINLNGRIVLFKAINKQQEELQSDFKPVAPDTTVQQALQRPFDK
ncbi:MAG TPA: hypothetical protein VGM27_02185 [Acidobacteriaceae bacterium]|jgi:hypothetical protein